MYKTDEFIMGRVIWKTQQYESSALRTFYFKDLTSDTQSYLTNYLDKEKSGPPVLYFSELSGEWILICTRQVVCYNNQDVIKIDMATIDRLLPTVLDDPSKSQLQKFAEGEHTKEELHELTVYDKKGNSYTLHTNKGAEFFALYDILLMAKRILSTDTK